MTFSQPSIVKYCVVPYVLSTLVGTMGQAEWMEGLVSSLQQAAAEAVYFLESTLENKSL